MEYLEFYTNTLGFTFHSKVSGQMIYKWELFWSGYTPQECFEKFDTKIVIHPIYEQSN
jgi:hypothetical protein